MMKAKKIKKIKTIDRIVWCKKAMSIGGVWKKWKEN